MADERTGDERRTTVSEAAEILGISAEAVRGRIRRGTIPVEREGGTVYILIEETKNHRTTGDQPRTTDDRPGDRTDLLIAELQDRVKSLEEANRENRRIIAALTSRIPAIEAPRGARESAETVEEEPEFQEPPKSPQTVEEETERAEAQATTQHEQAQRPTEGVEHHASTLREWTGDVEARRSDAGEAQEGVQRPWWRRWFGS